MWSALPHSYYVERVLTHPTWQDGATTHWVAVATWTRASLFAGSIAPKLVLFRETEGRLENCSAVSTYARAELAKGCPVVPTYVGVCVSSPDRPASVAAIRAHSRRGSEVPPSVVYDVTLYSLKPGALVQEVRLPSDAMPWVGDLDADGDAEIITWRLERGQPDLNDPFPWPIVHTLVDGRYEERTSDFRGLFSDMATALAEQDREGLLTWDHLYFLARVYEMLHDTDQAVAAYRRLEGKCREAINEADQRFISRPPAMSEQDERRRQATQRYRDILTRAIARITERRVQLQTKESTSEGAPPTDREAPPD
jgi:hypothetical protein